MRDRTGAIGEPHRALKLGEGDPPSEKDIYSRKKQMDFKMGISHLECIHLIDLDMEAITSFSLLVSRYFPSRDGESMRCPASYLLMERGEIALEQRPAKHWKWNRKEMASTTIARKGFAGLYFVSIDGRSRRAPGFLRCIYRQGNGNHCFAFPSRLGFEWRLLASGGMNSRRVLK